MDILKEEKGITILALVITVILLFIIGGVSIMGGTDLVNTAKAENIETNMLTIKAKAKAYMENVDSKNWALKQENKETENRKELKNKYKLTLIEDETSYTNYSNWYVQEDLYTYYALGQEALDKMGLSELYEDGEVYVIKYPSEPTTETIDNSLEIDVVYTNGIKYEDVIYYNLSELEKVL